MESEKQSVVAEQNWIYEMIETSNRTADMLFL